MNRKSPALNFASIIARPVVPANMSLQHFGRRRLRAFADFDLGKIGPMRIVDTLAGQGGYGRIKAPCAAALQQSADYGGSFPKDQQSLFKNLDALGRQLPLMVRMLVPRRPPIRPPPRPPHNRYAVFH